MGARQIPILITIDGAGQATAEVKGLTNAFDDLDKTTKQTGSGGLKNAFDSTSNLRSEVKGLGQDSEFVRNAVAALHNDVRKLSPTFQSTASSAEAVAAGTTSAGAGLGTMLGPIAALVIAIPLLIGLLSATAFGSFSLAKGAAEAGGKIHELQQESKLGAETLSALSVGAKLSGSDIGDLSGALDNFDKVITRANGSDAKLAKQLRDSNIDITNNERALRSIFQVLNQMPEGYKRAELADLAFGSSSKQVLQVVDQTNGNIDEAIKKYGALGLILSNEATRGADKFNDELALLNLQIDSVKVRVGQQLMPVVLDVVQRISTHVKNNQERWVEWARSAVNSGRDIKTGAETVGEAYGRMQTQIAQLSPAFHLLDDSMGASLGTMLRYGTGTGLVITGLEKLGNLVNRLKVPDPNAIPDLLPRDGAGKVTDFLPRDEKGKLSFPESGFTRDQLDQFQRELNPFINLFEGINARLETFGQTSHVAAVQQQALKLQIKELSPEVRDQAQAYITNALALAKQLDALEAQKKANDEAIKQAEKQTQANQNLRNEIDAVRLRTQQLGDAEGKTRSELEKFNEALIKRKDGGLLDAKVIEGARRAYADLDRALSHIAQTKAFDKLSQDRQQVVNSLQSIRENIAQAAAQAIPDVEQRMQERDAVLQRTARSIESIANLKIDRVQFAGLVDLFKSGPEAVELTSALEKLRTQLDPKVLENLAPRDVAQIVDLLFKAAEADRALTAAHTPLAEATRQLKQELKDLQNEVPIAAETAALRYEIAWTDANNAVALASDRAVVSQIYSQAKLADATIYHADQANAAVLDFLASQRSVTEVIGDAKVGVIQTTFDLIDRGLDKFTSKLGVIGSLVRELLSGFIRLALSKFFQSVLGPPEKPPVSDAGEKPPSAQSAQTAALSSIFGGGFGGGFSAPASLTSQLASQASISSAIHEAGHTAAVGAGAGGLLGGFGPAIGAMLPFLGLGLGAGVGGGSRFGSVLGGAGGLLAGGIGAAFLAPSLFAATGALGSLGPLLAGLLTNPITLVAAPLLLVGAFLLSRNAQRRRDETTRNQLSLDVVGQLNALLAQAKNMDIAQATAAFEQIRVNYFSQVNQMKDGKTKRIATDWWYGAEHPPQVTWKKIQEAVVTGERAREVEKRLIPEFAFGGTVPFGNTLFSMTTGLTPIKVRPGEVMIPPGGFGVTVPGTDYGYDSVYAMARPGTKVMTKSQQASAQGFVSGGTFGLGGEQEPIQIDIYLSPKFEIGKETAGEIVDAGSKTNTGRKALVTVHKSFNADGN